MQGQAILSFIVLMLSLAIILLAFGVREKQLELTKLRETVCTETRSEY